MKTVKGNPNTHYVSREEWDISYMVKKPIINEVEEGDIVIITKHGNSTTYTVVLEKTLKEI